MTSFKIKGTTIPNQVRDIVCQWYKDTTDLMEIDLTDLAYLSNHYIAKILLWLVNISSGLTERLIAIKKLV
jgi:hypothetical protein